MSAKRVKKTEYNAESRFFDLWKGITTQSKAAFLSCVIAGYITHLYAFTNLIPNSDGIRRLYDTQQMTVSGRWFIHYLSILYGFVEAPALLGFLSVLFMALAAVMVVRVLRLKGVITSALTGVLMIVFPSCAYTYLYMFTSSDYFAAMFLALLGVYVTDRAGCWGWIPGAFLLALSVGTYQSYLAAAIALALLSVLFYALDGEKTTAEVFLKGVRYVLFLGLGMVLYLVILKVFLKVKDLTLLSYLGMSSTVGGYPLAQLPEILSTAWKEFWSYFFVPGTAENAVCSYTTVTTVVLTSVLGAAGIVFLARGIVKKSVWKSPLKLVIAAAMLALLPIGMHFTRILNPNTDSTPLNRYAFVFFYLLIVALADRNMDGAALWLRGVRTASALASVLVVIVGLQLCNTVYICSETANRAAESFCTRLVERVESTEGYYNGMEVDIIGPMPESVYYSTIEGFTLVEHYSCKASTNLVESKHIYDYLNDWLNVQWEKPDEETLIAVSDSEAFQEMYVYPDDGSVKIIDGKMVVKLDWSYTPLQDFEIEYENRR